MQRDSAFRSRRHQILNPHIRECPTGHHQIVPAPAAVAVKIRVLDPARNQILPGWRRSLDCAGGRNVIGRDGIAENAQGACATDFLDMSGLHREILEKGRLMNVIALLIPLVNIAGARWNLIPLRILVRKIAIQFAKRLRRKS